MNLRSRFGDAAERAVSGLLVIAMLSFAHACAARGAACDGPAKASAASHGESDGDGCGDHDGCGDVPAGDCGSASMCCATWAPAPVAPELPAPQAAFVGTTALLPVTAPTNVFVAALVPIPSESPPPLISILRL